MYHADIISAERPRIAALVCALNRLRETPHAENWPTGCFDVAPIAGALMSAPSYARLVYVSPEPLSAQVADALTWFARAQDIHHTHFPGL